VALPNRTIIAGAQYDFLMAKTTPPITVRDLESDEDLAATLELEHQTWGPGFPECVPPALLRIGLHLGGVSAGAFLEDGTLAGFVYGLTGLDADGVPLHWSHMLAVRPELRNHGIGGLLKGYQRRVLTARGVPRMQWTYEPLEARNAHFNLNRLGCRVVAYQRNVYGDGGSSALHRGIGTDRFVVEVRLDGTVSPTPPADATVEVEIPADIQSLKAQDPDIARAWRRKTREAFEHYLALGYTVTAFQREASGRCCYLLSSPAP